MNEEKNKLRVNTYIKKDTNPLLFDEMEKTSNMSERLMNLALMGLIFERGGVMPTNRQIIETLGGGDKTEEGDIKDSISDDDDDDFLLSLTQ